MKQHKPEGAPSTKELVAKAAEYLDWLTSKVVRKPKTEDVKELVAQLYELAERFPNALKVEPKGDVVVSRDDTGAMLAAAPAVQGEPVITPEIIEAGANQITLVDSAAECAVKAYRAMWAVAPQPAVRHQSEQGGEWPAMSDEFYEGLGWMYAECCAALDRGEDPRTLEVGDMVDRCIYDLDLPKPAEQQPISHDWDDQDKCRRCGDRDWYASATCSPKQQPAPDVAGLVEALERCRHQASYSIGGEDALRIQLGKVRDIVNETLSDLAAHRKQEDKA